MNLQTNAAFGQYRILRLLGRGGMGEVYEVEHRVLERRYALKLLPSDFAARPEAIRRFEREAKVMANLDHPNIVRVDEFGETDGRYWLRMELVHGVQPEVITLGDYAAANGGRLDQDEFAKILAQVLEGLAYAHAKGVVHRDLKPGNILLEKTPSGELRAKVSDFGLARVIGEEFIRSQAQISVSRGMGLRPAPDRSLGEEKTIRDEEGTSTRALLGTWEYMSPEQRRGEDADARSDVYALGLMCFRILTGMELGLRPPSKLVKELASDWDEFIARAVEQSPASRYASSGEMRSAFANVDRAINVIAESRQQAELERKAAEQRQLEEERKRIEAEQQAAAESLKREQRAEAERSELEERQLQAVRLAAAQQQARIERQARHGSAQRTGPNNSPRKILLWMGAIVVALVALVGLFIRSAAPSTSDPPPPATETPADAGSTTTRSAHPTLDAPYENSLGMKLVPVPGTDALFCVWETRVRDYQAFAAANSGVDGLWRNSQYRGSAVTPEDTCPVVNVSCNDAKAFCEWLTRKERAEGKISPSQSYRLPRDWEWSVAVGLAESRQGTPKEKDGKIEGVYPWGREWPPPRGAGNYADATAKRPFNGLIVIEGYEDGYATASPVGSFSANRFGIYDLGGNVWEWCEDAYDGQGGSRVVRGGSWLVSYPAFLLSSDRNLNSNDGRSNGLGFRVVLVDGSSP